MFNDNDVGLQRRAAKVGKNWNGCNCDGGSSGATAAKHSARALRTALYALLLAAGLPFAAQAQTCVPGATADWMVTSDPLAAPIRPAECASVEQSPPDFGWPDISSDGVYQVTLTYPDGRAKTLAAAQNWINWNEALPAGTYSWQVELTDSSGTRISRARQFTVSANATPFLAPDTATLLGRVTAEAHPRGLPDPTSLALMLGDRQAAVSALASAVNSLLSSALPGAPSGSVESQVRDECMRTLNSLMAYLYTKQDIYFNDAARRVLNLASWDPRGSTSYANAAQASRFLAWTVALGYDWLSPRMPNGHKTQVLSMMRIRVGDMYNDVIGQRARIAKYPRDSQGNQTLVVLAVISTLLAGDLSEANTWLQSSLPLAINATDPWGAEEGGFANADAFGTWEVGELLVSWYILRWSAGVDLSQKAWVRNWSRFIAYFLPPGTPSGVFGDGAEQALREPWARFGKGYTHFAPTSLGRWYASQLTGEDPTRMEYLLSPLADLASNVFPVGTPSSAAFLSLGQAAMHSALADPARTSVYFKSSPAPYGSYDHSHADQNSFVVNAGGQRLAIDSGYYDGYKTPHWWQWYKQTRAHNAVTFDGGKGQLFFEQDGKMGYGAITNYALNPDHDIVHGDATQAYGGALREAKRSMLYLRPNLVLVYDRLASDTPRQWEWNIHALNLMNVVSDRQISIENNGQRLCVDMLAGPTMRFTQTDLFTADPSSGARQWHGNFSSVDLLGTAEFIALLNVGCTATTASASNTAGVWTVPVGDKIVTISDLGISVGTDTQAPGIPANLAATVVSSSQIDLAWSAATDNVGVSGYYVYRDNVQVANVSGTSYSDTGLAAATTYIYAVAAYDDAGNVSAKSPAVSAITPASALTAPASATTTLVSAPATPTPAPYSGVPIAMPGTLEAENFDLGGEGVAYHDNGKGNAGGQYRLSEDVDIIASSDSLGGGYVVNNFETGEWLAYTVNVATSAQYDIELRASSMFSNSAFHIEIDGVNVSGSVLVPNTASWNVFQGVGKKGVSLAAGTHVLKIVADQQYFNLNSVRVTPAPPAPYSGTPIAIPGTFEAENFDLGGEGVAYHDNSKGNAGGQYRLSEDVDIIASSDAAGGGYVVNNFETGEWLAYTVNVASSAQYDIELRVSSGFSNSAFHLEIDGVNVTGSVTVPNTGSWNVFQGVGKKGVSLAAGKHVLKIVSDQQYFDLNSVQVTATPVSTPYSGVPIAIPGSFEAENFDLGGEGFAYHDNVKGNAGGQYRLSEDVDIIASSDAAGGGYVVNNFETGEWLAYTVNVASSAQYDIELRVSSGFSNSAFHLEIDGVNVTGSVTVPNTGSWSTFQWVGKLGVPLAAGTHVLKIVADQQYFNLNSIRVTASPVGTSALQFFCTFANSPTDCGFQLQAIAPDRASLVNIGRDGSTSLRLHTEPGDNNLFGSGTMERADMYLSQADTDGYEGHEAWWAVSVLFPDDFAMPTWQGYVVFDFHHTGPTGQANFHVFFKAQPDITLPGILTLRGFGGQNVNDGMYEAPIGPAKKNVWYDFVYHVKWSSSSDGFFDAWVNGEQKLQHRGPTMYAGEGVYLKLANYHTPVCDPYPACTGTHPPSSVIHDRVIRGSTALSVSSGPLEGVLTLVNGVLTPLQ